MKRWDDYDRMARHVAPAAAELVAAVGSTAGPVIDIGSGSGNGLWWLQRSNIDGIGVDAAMGQLDTARPIGLPQIQGDAQALPVRTGAVATTISNFGIIFAPDPVVSLREAARCLAPGGILAFTAWVPGGWPVLPTVPRRRDDRRRLRPVPGRNAPLVTANRTTVGAYTLGGHTT